MDVEIHFHVIYSLHYHYHLFRWHWSCVFVSLYMLSLNPPPPPPPHFVFYFIIQFLAAVSSITGQTPCVCIVGEYSSYILIHLFICKHLCSSHLPRDFYFHFSTSDSYVTLSKSKNKIDLMCCTNYWNIINIFWHGIWNSLCVALVTKVLLNKWASI